MFYCPEKYNKKNLENVNESLLKLEGYLGDEEAKVTLARFLRANLGFTVELVTGIKLADYQVLLLKAFFNRNFSMVIATRGGSKSFIAAMISWLICLFEPNTRVLLCGVTFRTARNIFSYLEKIVESKDGILLQQCFTKKPSKRADLFTWEINGGSITAIPLNGEKVRGIRANVLIIDEFLLMSEDIIKNVLMPFLVAPSDIKERMVITEREDKLIAEGKIKESDRTIFPNTSRMIALSSASYTFENLYKVYTEWVENIYSKDAVKDATYFVSNISYQAIPSYMVEKSIIEEAKSGGEENAAFLREYGARFVDGSDSYFSAKRMHNLTVKDGDRPTTLLKGRPNKKYILSCDPSFSQSASSDNFTFAVLEINEDNETATLVHNYAKAGVELRKHIEYFYYLLTNFNIVLIIPDNADGSFILSANESALFKSKDLKIDFIDYDGSLKGEEYVQMLKEVRHQYNLEAKRICFKQIFNQESIRRMNEQLQTYINTNKIFFASKLVQCENDYEAALNLNIPIEFDKDYTVADLISDQDDLIYTVKKEASLIEIRTSPTGGQVFDLPASLKRNTSPTRARKDSYTALLLGVEGLKAYFDIMRQAPKQAIKTFTPRMFGNSTL